MTSVMEEDTKDTLMETSTKGSSSMEKLMEKEDISGSLQEKFMMESGLKESDMAMVFGRELLRTKMVQSHKLETPISASGGLVRLMDTESTHGKTEINMKENGKCA